MPFIMILILSLTTEDYMAPVFDTIVGRIVIDVCNYYYSHWIFCIKENHGHKDLGGGRMIVGLIVFGLVLMLFMLLFFNFEQEV